jgi:hypothetical protein
MADASRAGIPSEIEKVASQIPNTLKTPNEKGLKYDKVSINNNHNRRRWSACWHRVFPKDEIRGR